MSRAGSRKSIFITGAASGIGRETAKLFAEGGWFVGAYDLDVAGLSALTQEIGSENCITGKLDVVDRPAFEKSLAAFSDATGCKMDLLFNNAGIGKGGPFAEQPFEEMLQLVNVNFIGVLNGIYASLDMLKATPNSLCFSTSSSSATYGIPGIAVYSATKHAVKGLTEALSIEFRDIGVRVADTLPGLIDTNILPEGTAENASTEGMFRITQPIEIAKAVWASYHDDPNRLHWFVPEEIAELDKASALDPEGTRDGIAAQSLFNQEEADA